MIQRNTFLGKGFPHFVKILNLGDTKARSNRLDCVMFVTPNKKMTFHFNFQSPNYINLRKKRYLSDCYFKSPITFQLIQLLGSNHKSTLVGLDKYIHFALMMRNNDI